MRPSTAARHFPKQKLFQSHIDIDEWPSVHDTAQIPIAQRFEQILSSIRNMNAEGQRSALTNLILQFTVGFFLLVPATVTVP